MSPLCVLVHGYNANEGVTSIDLVAPTLRRRGFEVQQFDYKHLNGPLTGLIGATLLNASRATRLRNELAQDKKVVAIGHSNGCAILYRFMCAYPGVLSDSIFVNPALDRDVEFPDDCGKVTVYHTPGELPTRLARYIPFSLWGSMGAVGYQGPHPDVVNVDTSEIRYGAYASTGHSDKFAAGKVGYWADVFATRLLTS